MRCCQLLQANERLEAELLVQPPDAAEVCTDYPIEVTAWMPAGDTLIRLGGTTAEVRLRNRTEIDLRSVEVRTQDCTPTLLPGLEPGLVSVLPAARSLRAVAKVIGCTIPARPSCGPHAYIHVIRCEQAH